MSAKKRKTESAAVVVPSTERLRDLFVENTAVQKARNENDLLERIIMDKDGVDLRAVVAKVGAHVQHTAGEFNALHDRMHATLEKRNETSVSQFMQAKLTDEDLRQLEHQFAVVIDGNPNDDMARVAQLAYLFQALTNDIDVRQQLTAQPKHVERFADDGSALATTAPKPAATAEEIFAEQERAQRERANLIQNGPLYMFLKNDSRRLSTRLTESVIDLRQYVSECVSQYLSYKRAVCPHVARQYYDSRTT